MRAPRSCASPSTYSALRCENPSASSSSCLARRSRFAVGKAYVLPTRSPKRSITGALVFSCANAASVHGEVLRIEGRVEDWVDGRGIAGARIGARVILGDQSCVRERLRLTGEGED